MFANEHLLAILYLEPGHPRQFSCYRHMDKNLAKSGEDRGEICGVWRS